MKVQYKGKTVDVLPPIKRYVNAIERRLRLPRRLRARVMSDFATSICARREAGESVQEIMDALGTPAEVAAQLNAQMADYTYTKSPWRFVCLALALLCLLWLAAWGLYAPLMNGLRGAQGVIGGADGPTSIMILSTGTSWLRIALAAALAVAGLYGFWRLGHCKPHAAKEE